MRSEFLSLLLFVSFLCTGKAHPIPDLPVWGNFDANGTSFISIEIDPRAFSDNPEKEPFLTSKAHEKMQAQEQERLLHRARRLVEDSLLVRLNHEDWSLPDFTYDFLTLEKKDGAEEPIVFLQARAELQREENSTYQIMAKETAPLDLIFANRINGVPHRRVNVLFPGEESFPLPLPSLKSSSEDAGGSWSTFASFFRQGFLHVLPLGVDHVLFVIGLFLMSRKWNLLIYQVSAFTVAHTLTLGMATMGWVSVPSGIVEPIIAASIAFVALENVFLPKYHPRRLLLVFFFGLIHGLGFAGALGELNLNPSILLFSLIGFNLGVEGGQLTVVLLSLVGVFPFRNQETYRSTVVIPLSLLIAGIGIFWTIERIWN